MSNIIKIQSAWWVGEAITDHESSVIATTAGLGSGKTHGGCQWHDHRVRDNAGCLFSAFMEPTFQKVMDTAIPTYQKILRSYGLGEGTDYKVVKSPYPKIIYLDQEPNHEVHFLSAETPEKIAGVEYSHASEDEAGINSGVARQNLRGRLFRDKKVNIPQYLIFGAPQGINEFAEEFDSETLPDWNTEHPRDHYKISVVEGVRIKKRRFILWTDDNPFVTDQYLAELQDTYGHNPNLIRSYRYGHFCPLVTGGAYSNYFPQKHDLENKEAEPYREIYLTFDFNANPVAWVAVQKLSFVQENGSRDFKYVAIDECNGALGASQDLSALDDACIEFYKKFPILTYRDTPIKIFGDRSGHSKNHRVVGSDYDAIRENLEKLGYRNIEIVAARQVAPESESVEAVQRLFLNNLLFISKKCRLLRKSLLATVWKQGIRKLEKKQGETHTHHGDALKYWAYQCTLNDTMARNDIIGTNF